MKPKILPALHLALAVIAVTAGCASTESPTITSSLSEGGHGIPYGTSDSGPFLPLEAKATSDSYGYSREDPIKTGPEDGGAQRSRLYLNGLRGPKGEAITFERTGSCCEFETSASSFGSGLLDVYEITYPGLKKPILLYVDLYDQGEMLIPVGFTARDE